jgi:hypothetical protein
LNCRNAKLPFIRYAAEADAWHNPPHSDEGFDNVSVDISAKRQEFGIGLEDALLFPLVVLLIGIRLIGKVLLTALINVFDFAFPLIIQLVRFPLFTARILGDGAIATLNFTVRVLPLPERTRSNWQARLVQKWSALRAMISYRAFERGMHHLFEAGMAWVFRTCRKLTPRQALWVIAAAALWLPISFAIATVMHAVLLAYAAVLPAWMQLLHPLATFIAKSKLLVLPVYPAAWPQAKRHPFVQTVGRGYARCRQFYLIRKAGHRYRRMETIRQEISGSIADACARAGVTRLSENIWSGTIKVLAWPVAAFHWSLRWAFTSLANVLLIGPVLRSYAAHYAAVEQCKAQKTSDRMSGLFEEWAIKFSAEYYERREREKEREKEERGQLELALRMPSEPSTKIAHAP